MLADKGWKAAARLDKALSRGVNLVQGKVTYKAVAEAFGLDYTPLQEMLA
jgi:alanine dehydrogenase